MIFLFLLFPLIFALRLGAWQSQNSYRGQLLSKPARDILARLRALPADSRVVGIQEMKRTLAALDNKYQGRRAVREHFTVSTWDSYVYEFPKCDCSYRYDRGCSVMSEYPSILKSIHGVEKALAAKEEAIRVSTAEKVIDVKSITERFRDEKAIQEQVTRELS